ncbi:MAG: hypothetical protein AAF226_01955 [Verrucomicrobiota bacterium]
MQADSDFVLVYEGELKASSNSSRRKNEKETIRKQLSPQIEKLWGGYPYSELKVGANRDEYPVVKNIGESQYVPLVTERSGLVVKLSIQILRDEQDARLIDGGDIDNRLKTLIDGLRAPSSESEVPKSDSKATTFTLLEDDKSIVSINLDTARNLRNTSRHGVLALLGVSIITIHPPVGRIRIL